MSDENVIRGEKNFRKIIQVVSAYAFLFVLIIPSVSFFVYLAYLVYHGSEYDYIGFIVFLFLICFWEHIYAIIEIVKDGASFKNKFFRCVVILSILIVSFLLVIAFFYLYDNYFVKGGI